ncbi:Uncharacterised protein [Legionella wadsworthii]|uniref:Uncharacterized protein n=1 Tax=Legionella wadsworthii TaxID=28088 RepID=A0A378LVS0_9GAMM|nr:hypothetical protein [Legionella wadsworthii]STY29933.1 Uncharacterised protein [Legionella wadsworthii]
MKKIYAIVSPAYTKVGDGFTDLASYFALPFHTVAFEQISGYSLGHKVLFTESLETAKGMLESGIQTSKSDAKTAIQKAIIELDADDEEKITGFNKIYTVDYDKRYEQAENNFFKSLRIPKWSERAINAQNEATSGALDEMNIQYQQTKQATPEPALT